MKGAVVYALFGYNKAKVQDSFDFISYLRGLLLAVRMNRVLFPWFDVVLETDEETYNAYKYLFDNIGIKVEVNDPAPLTKAMLWRMKPVFNYNEYTHVLCRDLDAPPTYREAQAVQDWINNDHAAHAITDSVSHNLPMLGGMIGFRPQYFPMYTKYQHWTDMFDECLISFTRKGEDQFFLNKYIYPKFANPEAPSITQHYMLGMAKTFLPGYKNFIPDIEVKGVAREMDLSNECCSHIGQAGWLLPQTFRFLQKYQDQFKDILEVEKKFPEVAYWVKDGTFK